MTIKNALVTYNGHPYRAGLSYEWCKTGLSQSLFGIFLAVIVKIALKTNINDIYIHRRS